MLSPTQPPKPFPLDAPGQTRAGFRFSILELMIVVVFIACFLACLFSNWTFVIIALVIHVVVFWPTRDWLTCEPSQRMDLDKLRKVCTMWAVGNWLMLGLTVATWPTNLVFVVFTSVECATAFGSAWLFQVAILWSRDCVRRHRMNKSEPAGSQDA